MPAKINQLQWYVIRCAMLVLIPGHIGRPSLGQCIKYSAMPITLGCNGSVSAQALSPQGDVVGHFACIGGEDRAFVWWGSDPLAVLNLPNQFWSRAYDVNANLQITGAVEILGVGIRGYLFQNGITTTILDVLPNHDTSEGFALNRFDVAVGYSANTQVGPVLACRWVDGKVESLGLPQGPGGKANGVNDRGQIVGYMGSLPAGNLPSEAFLWHNGVTTPLGKPRGATNSNANAISNTGIICGHYTIADPQGAGGYKPRALAWINGQMVDLGVLPGYLNSRALDVNDSGTIVGNCNNPPLLGNGVKAFLWRDGQMFALSDLLAPEFAQYQVWYARSINNSGQIAVTLKPPLVHDVAARLDPIPPRSGDTNCDWLVNVNDLLNVINAWGPAAAKTPFQGSPDLNDDGTVNVNDLLAVINDWG